MRCTELCAEQLYQSTQTAVTLKEMAQRRPELYFSYSFSGRLGENAPNCPHSVCTPNGPHSVCASNHPHCIWAPNGPHSAWVPKGAHSAWVLKGPHSVWAPNGPRSVWAPNGVYGLPTDLIVYGSGRKYLRFESALQMVIS